MNWTLSFLRRLGRHVTLASAVRLRGMVLRDGGKQPSRPGLTRIRVKHPFQGDIWLREPGSDVETFFEIVVHEIYRRAVELAPNAEYVVDLGGNIGLTTRYFAARLSTCRVIIVEPARDSFELLCRNVAELTAIGRCHPIHGAIWGDDSDITVSAPPEGTRHHAITVQARTEECRETVRGYSMRSLLEKVGFPWIDILKIDIEGSETTVFKGNTDWLSAVRVITIEFHGTSRSDSGFDEVVRRHGFEVQNDDFPNTVLAVRKVPPSPV